MNDLLELFEEEMKASKNQHEEEKKAAQWKAPCSILHPYKTTNKDQSNKDCNLRRSNPNISSMRCADRHLQLTQLASTDRLGYSMPTWWPSTRGWVMTMHGSHQQLSYYEGSWLAAIPQTMLHSESASSVSKICRPAVPMLMTSLSHVLFT